MAYHTKSIQHLVILIGITIEALYEVQITLSTTPITCYVGGPLESLQASW